MANIPTIVVGTGNQQKVVTPALLTGLDSTGLIVALKVDASGNLLTAGGSGDRYLTSSTTSNTVGNGAKTFTVGTFNNGILNQFYRNGFPPPIAFGGYNTKALDVLGTGMV